MAAEIFKLELVEKGIGGDKGTVFTEHYMGPVFSVFNDSIFANGSSGRNYWDKNTYYAVHDDMVVMNHTAAKVFDAANLRCVGYAVLKDDSPNTLPTLDYYFSRDEQSKYVLTQMDPKLDRVFYLGDEKYHLAADGTITVAKKEEQVKQEPVIELQNEMVKVEQSKKELPSAKEESAKKSRKKENISGQSSAFFRLELGSSSSSCNQKIKRGRFAKES